MTAPSDMSRIAAPYEACKRADSRQPLVAGLRGATSVFLQMSEELQHQTGGDVADEEAVIGFLELGANERQKQLKSIPVALTGIDGQIALGDDVLQEKAFEPGA